MKLITRFLSIIIALHLALPLLAMKRRGDEQEDYRPAPALRAQEDLFAAAQEGDIPRMRTLIQKAAINGQDTIGYTALHYATLFGNLSAVQYLLEQGADINGMQLSSPAVVCPLQLAVIHKHDQIAIKLINSGANINFTCAPKFRELISLHIPEHRVGQRLELTDLITENFYLLAVHGLNVENKGLIQGRSLYAVRAQKSIDQDFKTSMTNNNLITARERFDKGANVSCFSNLSTAITNNSLDVVKFLLKNVFHGVAVDKALCVAARNGKIDGIKLLLDACANAEYQDFTNKTPLCEAIASMDTAIIKLLIKKGVSVDPDFNRLKDIETQDEVVISRKERIPLHLAITKNNTAIVNLLLSHGAKLNHQALHNTDSTIEVAIHHVNESHSTDSIDIARLIILAGATINEVIISKIEHRPYENMMSPLISHKKKDRILEVMCSMQLLLPDYPSDLVNVIVQFLWATPVFADYLLDEDSASEDHDSQEDPH